LKLLIVTFYKLKMMLSDKLFFAAMVIIPLFITVATGYALRYEKLNIIPIAVVDEDNSSYSKTLTERLSAIDSIRIEYVSKEKSLKMLEGNEVEHAFVVKKGFEEKIISGETDGIIDMISSPATFSTSFVSEVVSGEIIRFITNNMAANWVLKQYTELNKPVDENLRDELINYTDAQWEPEPLMTMRYREYGGNIVKDVDRVTLPAATATSTGIIVVFIMFYVLFSSGWLIEERVSGTLKRLVAGPGALGYSFGGSILALLASGMLQIMIFSVINKVIFGVDLFPGVFSYIIFAAYLLAVISVCMLLSSLLKTPAQLQAIAPVLALLTGFIGGCFWNFVEMSGRLKRLSLITPQGWALEGINRLLLNPADFSAVAFPSVVLFSISLILLPLSYIIISKRITR
jgi:ABC-2 type transport system permease protein